MLRPERLRGWCAFVGAALLACVALVGTGARASVPSMQEARATSALTMTAPGMPMVSGGMPCVVARFTDHPCRGVRGAPLGAGRIL